MTTEWLNRGAADENRNADDVSAVVREYRLASSQNQASVASAMGMTQQHLSQIEKGKRPASLEQRRTFAEVLRIPPEHLGLSDRARPPVSADDTAPAIAESRGRWRAQRAWLNEHRSVLAKLAVDLYPAESRVPRTPLIAGEGWVPDKPLPLREMSLSLDEQPQSTPVTGREPETEQVRPLRAPDVRFDSYTAAIKNLNPPALFESRPSYRLLDASVADRRLGFGLAAYFDKLDVSEALAHEMAAACMTHGVPDSADGLRGKLPFRELLGDPFDPARRAIIPAITTLTIRLRRYPAEHSFLLHWRDPTKVATAAGIYDVLPAGEFQPSSVALWDRRNDFDLWRNMVREYSEELLGAPEHDGTRTDAIDYDNWELYQRLGQAQDEGAVTAHLLGIGLDALSLAATILTVVVIDDDVFEDAFGNAVRVNDEGEIVGIGDDRAAEGVPFTADAVNRMLAEEPMASPGAACLALAWQHRDQLMP